MSVERFFVRRGTLGVLSSAVWTRGIWGRIGPVTPKTGQLSHGSVALVENERPLVLFDLDGTICHNAPGLDFMDAYAVHSGCRGNPAVIKRIKALHDSGTCDLGVLTARNGHILGGVSEGQLNAWLGPGVYSDLFTVKHSRIGSFNEIGASAFYLAVREYKAAWLSQLQPVVYVGDTSTDADAAKAAGIPFMPVGAFGRGDCIPGLQDWLEYDESDDVLRGNRDGDSGAVAA